MKIQISEQEYNILRDGMLVPVLKILKCFPYKKYCPETIAIEKDAASVAGKTYFEPFNARGKQIYELEQMIKLSFADAIIKSKELDCLAYTTKETTLGGTPQQAGANVYVNIEYTKGIMDLIVGLVDGYAPALSMLGGLFTAPFITEKMVELSRKMSTLTKTFKSQAEEAKDKQADESFGTTTVVLDKAPDLSEASKSLAASLKS